ncbi:MAG: DUF5655 domain-containing protein [Micropepsaceae bacterium]
MAAKAAKKYGEPERGLKWAASVEANLEKATGKSMQEWVKIAKTCPHDKMAPRLKWFKQEHGLSVARAGAVIEKAFGADAFGWSDPETLVDNLFAKSFAPQRAIYEAVEAYVRKFDGVILSPRKGYVALYRLKQFGAIKPSKEGLLVGLAMQKYPKAKRLIDVKNLGGGERNKKALVLASAKELDTEAKELIKAAWAES